MAARCAGACPVPLPIHPDYHLTVVEYQAEIAAAPSPDRSSTVLARNDKRNAANEHTRRYREWLGKGLSIAPTPVNDATSVCQMPFRCPNVS